MLCYRITLQKYSDSLFASGKEGRWNFKGDRIIYTSESRSLACLENLVHSSGETLLNLFRVMIIYIPDQLSIAHLDHVSLPENWNQQARPKWCQERGNRWLEKAENPVLKVPSAIVNKEFNYLINPNHPEFKKVKIIDTEPFPFDQRLQ